MRRVRRIDSDRFADAPPGDVHCDVRTLSGGRERDRKGSGTDEKLIICFQRICLVLSFVFTVAFSGVAFGNTPSVPLAGVSSIALGSAHTCAIVGAGRVICWGQNAYGQLGNGTALASMTAPPVVGLPPARSIAAGSTQTCALLIAGAVRCWGRMQGLADSDRRTTWTDSLVPVEMPGLGVITVVSVGSAHICALLETGAVKCWSSNQFGQLGDGTTVDRSVAVQVRGLEADVVAILTGTVQTCALLRNTTVRVGVGRPNATGRVGAGDPFSVVVEMRRGSISLPVQAATVLRLELSSGIGPLNGPSGCMISAGERACTASGLLLHSGQSAATLVAIAQTADGSMTASSEPFSVGSPTVLALDVAKRTDTPENKYELTATVSSSGGLPTGTVAFRGGFNDVLCQNSPVLGGVARCDVTLSRGPNSVVATYFGSDAFGSSISPRVDVEVLAHWLVNRNGRGSGRIVSEDGAIDCTGRCTGDVNDYKSFNLRAVPDPGSVFTGWAGDCRGQTDCTLYVYQYSNAPATFVLAAEYLRALDVDGDVHYDALTDGVLVLRYLSGITGPALVLDALATGASRRDPVSIRAYLDEIRLLLDIDGSGSQHVL